MNHRTSPVCLHCKYMTAEYSKILRAKVLGCSKSGVCKYEPENNRMKVGKKRGE